MVGRWCWAQRPRATAGRPHMVHGLAGLFGTAQMDGQRGAGGCAFDIDPQAHAADEPDDEVVDVVGEDAGVGCVGDPFVKRRQEFPRLERAIYRL